MHWWLLNLKVDFKRPISRLENQIMEIFAM
jgi:hypothetical protein